MGLNLLRNYDYDRYEPHEHVWNNVTLICKRCGITAEAVHRGRDKPPTWYDVDAAYEDGRRVGIEIGAADYKQRRRLKLIEVGYYLCLRQLGQSARKKEK